MTAERHMVIIHTERTGTITLTPEQFDMLLASAEVGLEGAPFEGPDVEDLWSKITAASKAHAA